MPQQRCYDWNNPSGCLCSMLLSSSTAAPDKAANAHCDTQINTDLSVCFAGGIICCSMSAFGASLKCFERRPHDLQPTKPKSMRRLSFCSALLSGQSNTRRGGSLCSARVEVLASQVTDDCHINRRMDAFSLLDLRRKCRQEETPEQRLHSLSLAPLHPSSPSHLFVFS